MHKKYITFCTEMPIILADVDIFWILQAFGKKGGYYEKKSF